MIPILLAMAMMQQPRKGCLPVKTYDPTACMVDPTKPPKCEKYQHEDRTGIYNGREMDWGPRCVDDIHTLTEKEWQELQCQVKVLMVAARNGTTKDTPKGCTPGGHLK